MRHQCIDIDSIQTALDVGETILVPNNRTRDAILLRLAQTRGTRNFLTPAVFAIDIWIRELWDRLGSLGYTPCAQTAILSSMEEEFIWTTLIEDSLDQYPLLNPEQTAGVIRHAFQLMKLWRLDTPDDSDLKGFDAIPDIAAFLIWKNRFESLCGDSAVLNLVSATSELIVLLQSQRLQILPERFVLLNFFNPPPLYRDLFAVLPNVTKTSSIDAQATPTVTAARAEFNDRHAEIRACAGWVAAKCAEEPQAHVGVICNQRPEREAEFTRALADALHPETLFHAGSDAVLFNSSGSSLSLLDSGMIYDALLIMGLAQPEQQADELCRLLQSPFIGGSEEEIEARRRLEVLMRKRLTRRCSVTAFGSVLNRNEEELPCPLLADALLQLKTLYRRLPKPTTSRAWADFFRTVLEFFGWPGGDLSQHELRLYKQWQSALEQFSAAGPVLGSMDILAALSRFRQLLQNTPQWRETGLTRQVSFYSVNEALGLHFDHLWLLGFDDQNWPGAARPTPFLPYPLQKQARIPGSHSDFQHQLAAEETAVLKTSVRGELIISHPLVDGDQEFRPSSLALDLPQSEFEQPVLAAINYHAMNKRENRELEVRLDSPCVPVTEFTEFSGGHSLISEQSACPFRAFAHFRLQVTALEEFGQGLDARQRGTAMHKALEYLFSEITDRSVLLALSQVERERLCREAARIGVESLERRYQELLTPRLRAIESRRYLYLLMKFLDLESQREDFSVLARERRVEVKLDKLGLTLKIDRLDRLGDQRLAVIDYKSGHSNISINGLLQDRPEDMQVSVYCTAVDSLQEGAIAALGFARISREGIKYSMLCADRGFHRNTKSIEEMSKVELDWEELCDTFRDKVSVLAREFAAGQHVVAPVNPHTTCQYCDLKPLCRIKELCTTGDEIDSGGDA